MGHQKYFTILLRRRFLGRTLLSLKYGCMVIFRLAKVIFIFYLEKPEFDNFSSKKVEIDNANSRIFIGINWIVIN